MERIRKIRFKQNLVEIREANVGKGTLFTKKRKAAQGSYRKLI